MAEGGQPINMHNAHPVYRPDIDGLRAIAILSVVIYHAFPTKLRGGFVGVDIFFVISGFLISSIIFRSLQRGDFNFGEFYARRVRRIFPALILVLAASYTVGWFVLLPDEFKQLGRHMAAGAGFVQNIVLYQEAGYFDTASELKPLMHLWSLSIEEQFYLVFPVLIWGAWRLGLNALSVALLLVLLSFGLNLGGIEKNATRVFFMPQTRFWELLAGSVLAYVQLFKAAPLAYWLQRGVFHPLVFRHPPAAERRGAILNNLLAFGGLLLIVAADFGLHKGKLYPGGWALFPVLGACMLILAGSGAWVNRKILANRWVVFVGLISYPLYLWHWPLLSFARLMEGETPSRNIRMAVVALSFVLAWLTYRLIERPLRLGGKTWVTTAVFCLLLTLVGYVGYNAYVKDGLEVREVGKLNFGFLVHKSDLHGYEKLIIYRKGFEHLLGSSLAWYKGKEDWLFLGNAHNGTVAKLKLANIPAESETEATKEIFSKIARAGAKTNTKIILIVGANKSSIYPEYLPDQISPSTKKYISFFLDKLKGISNLTVYNSTDDLLRNKKTAGILYWMTDTHWNNKGAFIAYSGFSNLLGLPIPEVEFQYDSTHSGDLINISKLKNFPLHAEDNWNVVWKNKPIWTQKEIPNEQTTAFGSATVVTNQQPLSNQSIWVVGDSYTGSLKQYLNATFKEVRYLGHWAEKLIELPTDIEKADKKPDMIIIIRVERTF